MEKVLDYARRLIGVPYRWYHEGAPIQGDNMFWASHDPAPSSEDIHVSQKSIVCTGLINLMRRFQNLSVPGLDGSLGELGRMFPGTTSIWFLYLSQKNRLKIFNPQEKYPKGTLLLRNFSSNTEDQGHVAVIILVNGRLKFLVKNVADLAKAGAT